MISRIRSVSVLNKGLTVFLSVLMVFTMGPWTQVVEANAEEIKAAQTATTDAMTSDSPDATVDAVTTGEATTDEATTDAAATDAAATAETAEATTEQAATTDQADTAEISLEPQAVLTPGETFPTTANNGDTFKWTTNNITYTYYAGKWYPEEIVDGNFTYPDASAVVSSNWIYIDSANGGYRTQGKQGTFSPFASQSFDWYSDEATVGAISKFVELNTDTSDNSYNQYAELCAQTKGLSIYQDVATVPNALYKWSLKHASMYPNYVDQMQVKIGTTSSQSPQTATRTSTNGASFTGRSTGDGGIVSGDTNQVGFSATTIETPTTGTGSGSHRASHAANNDWETYIGTYMVPDQQNITRFTFLNVASAGVQEGNHLDDISFKIAYPLYYAINGGQSTVTRGDGLPYCGSGTTAGGATTYYNSTSSYQNYFFSGSHPALATLGDAYSYTDSADGTTDTSAVKKADLTHDSMPTSIQTMVDGTAKSITDKVVPLGWSETANGILTTKAQIAAAGLESSYAGTDGGGISASGTNDIVYATWAQQYTLYFDKNATGITTAAPADQTGNPSYTNGTAAYSASADPSSGTTWKIGSTTLRDGYIFEGWYTDAGCTTAYTFGSTIEADTHLYAKWTPLVTVSKTLTSTDYSANPATATYIFTVKNNSDIDLTNFTFTDTIGENLTYIDESAKGATTDDHGKTFTVANIGKKGSNTDTVTVTASFSITDVSKEFENSAAGNGKPTSTLTKTAYSDSDCKTPLAKGDSLVKGQTVYYKIVRTNTSTTSALAADTVTDTLSDGLTCADATASDSTEADPTVSVSGKTITWKCKAIDANKSGNAASTLTVTATVDVDATVSEVTNTVTDGFETVVVSNPLPSVSLSKTLTSVNGNIATYTIKATNSGHLAATNYSFTEDYGNNLTYKAVSGDAKADNETGSSFTFASIPAATFDASGAMTAAGTATATITCAITDTSKSFLNTAAELDASNAGLTKVAYTDAACQTALGDSPVYPGETIYYKLTRSNTGAGLLAAGTVTDTLGAGLTYVSATPATSAEIDGSATAKGQVVTWNVPAITADQATASIVIAATVDEGDYEYVTNAATDGHTTVVVTNFEPHVAVVKTIAQVSDVNIAAKTVTYTLTFTNSSFAPYTGYTFTEDFGKNLTFKSANGVTKGATTAAGTTFTVDSAIPAAMAEDTTLKPGTITATITFDITDTSQAFLNNATGAGTNGAGLTKVAYTDAECTKALGDAAVYAGETIYYKLTRSNTGTGALAAGTVTDTLGAGLTYVSATPVTSAETDGSATDDGQVVTWSVPPITADQGSASIVVAATVDAGTYDYVSNSATDGHNNVVVSNPEPHVTIAKTLESYDLAAKTATYHITLTNTGKAPAAGYVFTDDFGTNLSYGGAAVTNATTTDGKTFTANTVPAATFSPDGIINAAGTLVVSVTYNIRDVSKSFVNNATGAGTSDAGLTKVAYTDAACETELGDAPVREGETIYYKLTRSNTGTGALAAGTVTDTLGAGLTYVSATPVTSAETDGSATDDGQVVTWSVPPITADQGSASIVVAATVDAGTYDAVTNSATDGHNTTVVTNPEYHVTLSKTLKSVDYTASPATATYDVTLANTGTTAAANYTFTENFGSNLTFKSVDGATTTDNTTFTVASIGAGTPDIPGTATVTIVCTIGNTSAEFVNSVASPAADPNDTLTKVAYSDAGCTQALADGASLAKGQTVYYRVTRTDTSTTADLVAATVTDTLSDGLTLVSAVASDGTEADPTVAVDGQTITWASKAITHNDEGDAASTLTVAATVDSDATVSTVSNSVTDGTHTTVVTDPLPSVLAIKMLETCKLSDKTVTYRIVVNNSGDTPASGYAVTENFGTNLTDMKLGEVDSDDSSTVTATASGNTITFSSIPAKDTVSVPVTFTIKNVSDPIKNELVTPAGGYGDAALDKAIYSDEACTQQIAAGTSLDKGQTVYYKITRTDKSKVNDLAADHVEDLLSDGLTYVDATSSDGGAVTYRANDHVVAWDSKEITHNADGNANSTLVVRCTVNSSGDFDVVTNSVSDGTDTVIITNPVANITISKQLTSTDLASATPTATYTISVHNSGAGGVSGYQVNVTDIADSNLTYQGVTGATTPAEGDPNHGKVFSVDVAAGATAEVVITFKVNDVTKAFTNSAYTDANDGAALTKVAYYDEACTQEVGTGAVYAGQTIYYKLTRTNTSKTTDLPAGTVTDTFGTGLTYMDAKASDGGEVSVSGQVVTWKAAAIKYNATGDAASTLVVAATVDLSGTDAQGNAVTYDAVSNSATDGTHTTVVTNPEVRVSITKWLDSVDYAKKTATYKIYLTNFGVVAATNYTFTEDYGDNLTYQSSSCLQAMKVSDDGKTFTIATVPPMKNSSDFISVTITCAIGDVTKPFTNKAIATDVPDFALTKTAYTDADCTHELGTNAVYPGQTIYYKVTRTNTSTTSTLPAGDVPEAPGTGITVVGTPTASDGGEVRKGVNTVTGGVAYIWFAKAIAPNTAGDASSYMVITATVDATGTDAQGNVVTYDAVSNSATDGTHTTVVTNPEAHVTIAKELDTIDYAKGTATYKIHVKNQGNVPVNGYTFTDDFGGNLKFKSGDYTTDGKTFTIDTLAAKGTADVKVTYTIDDTGKEITNSARSSTADPSSQLTKVAYTSKDCAEGTELANGASLSKGQTIYYKITRTNTSTATVLPAATVTDTLSTGLTYIDDTGRDATSVDGQVVTWKCPEIAKSTATELSSASIIVTAKVGADATVDAVSNSVTDGGNTTVVTNPLPSVTAVKLPVASTDVDLVNKTVKYTIAVTNSGKGDANNYQFTEQPGSNLSGMTLTTDTEGVTAKADENNVITVSKVAAGKTVNVYATFTIKDTAGSLDNAIVHDPTAAAGLTKTAYSDAACSQAIPAGAAVLKGQTIYYKVERKNTSTTDKLAGATITDTASTGLTVVGATATDQTDSRKPSVSGQTITWQAQELAAGIASSMTVTCTVNSSGSFSTVSNSATDGNKTVVVTNEVPSITVAKTLTSADLAGASAVYDIAVTNSGAGAAAGYAVDVTDVASDNLKWDSFSDNAKNVATDGSSFTVDVPASQTVHVTATYTIKDTAKGFTNHATVNPNEGETLVKRAFDPAGNEITDGSPVYAGEVITYKVTRTNTSKTATLSGATVVDTMATGLTYVADSASADDSGTVAASGQTVTWTCGDIKANEAGNASATLTFQATVDQSGTVDVVSNSVTDGTLTDVVTNPLVKVSVKKTLAGYDLAAKTATYEIALTNTGKADTGAYSFQEGCDNLSNPSIVGTTVDGATVPGVSASIGENNVITVTKVPAGKTVTVRISFVIDGTPFSNLVTSPGAGSSALLKFAFKDADCKHLIVASDTVYAGQTIYYQVVRVNTSATTDLAAGTVTDTLGAGLTFVSAKASDSETAPTYDATTRTVTWNAAAIVHDVGGAAYSSMVVAAMVDANGTYDAVTNSATDGQNNVVVTNPVAKVTLKKAISSITYAADGSATATYKITLSNVGNGTVAAGYRFSGTMINGTVDTSSVTNATYDQGQNAFVTTAAIAPGGSLDVTVIAKVDASAAAKQSSNQAAPADSAWTLSKTRVAGLSSTDTSSDDSMLSAGSKVFYKLTIDNSNGTVALPASVTATTESFKNLTFVTAEDGSGNTVDLVKNADGTYTWNAGEVASKATANVWLEFTVNADVSTTAPAFVVENTASAYDHTVVTSSPVVEVTAVKSASKITYNSDDTATVAYSIAVENKGATPAVDYVLSDVATNGAVEADSVKGATYDATAGTFTIARLAAGEKTTVTYTATVDKTALSQSNKVRPLSPGVGSDWELLKNRVDADGSTTVATSLLSPGDTVWYLLTIDNSEGTEPIDSSDAIVTDTFANLTYVTTGTVSQGDVDATTSGSSTITWNAGDVDAGEVANAWVEFTVADSATDDPADENYATAINAAEASSHNVTHVDPVAKPTTFDPPAQKIISGDTPSSSSEFTFRMTAGSDTTPMPNGQVGGSETTTITGAGLVEFGTMEYAKAGTYTYTLAEEVGSVDGYTYDTTIYTLTVTVVADATNQLVATGVVTDADGNTVDVAKFTNTYTAPAVPVSPVTPATASTTPKTGDSSWTGTESAALASLAAGMVAVAWVIRRRNGRNGSLR